MEELVKTVEQNLAGVREGIEKSCVNCGRKPSNVTIMAVTKTHPVEYVKAALECGIRHIGENRVSEGGRKIKVLGRDSAIYHAIGVLHRKEVRQAVRDFHWIDAVDDPRVLEEIAKREADPAILIEVNTSGEEAKKGFPPEANILQDVVGSGFDMGLQIRGFLTVGPLGAGLSERRKAFSLLRELRDDVSGAIGRELPVLSMGMSDDYAEAVLEGSTMVRLGRVLFGSRG